MITQEWLDTLRVRMSPYNGTVTLSNTELDRLLNEIDRLRATLAGLPEVLEEAIGVMNQLYMGRSCNHTEVQDKLRTFAQRMNQGK